MTARAILDSAAADKLAKICGLLGSSHDGERAAAAAKANDLVRSLGLDWRDVIGAPNKPKPARPLGNQWRNLLRYCNERRYFLTPKDRQFLDGLARWHNPSERQLEWIADIYARLYEAGR